MQDLYFKARATSYNFTVPMKTFGHPKFSSFLRRSLLLALMALGIHFSAWAQPIVRIGDANPNNGDNFCVPVSVVDFTDITEISFSIQYDPTIVDFVNVTNINATMAANGFTVGNVVVDEPNGTISVSGWATGPCSNPNITAVTLGTGEVAVPLFELCFTAIGSYGQQTLLQLTNFPTPIIVYRQNVITCFNLGLRDVDTSFGTVTIGVRPFTVNISNEVGSVGDQVCVDFLVTQGWDNLASIQFSLNYDPAFLQYQSLIHNDAIPNLAGAGQSFGVPGIGMVPPGVITCSWAAPINQPNITIPDSTLLFQACFTIIGDCESTTLLEFSENPRPIEITNNVAAGFPIPFNGNTGVVTSDECDPTGIQLNVLCGQAVNLNDQICVQVAVGDNFQNVRGLDYIMQWNPSILEFSSVGAFGLTGLTAARFDASNTDDGILGLDWAFTAGPGGVTRPTGSVIYEVCFTVVGLGGDSPFNIIRPGGEGVIVPGTDIGINPSNCVVQVNQPTGVGMVLGDVQAPTGGTACMPVSVVNFDDIVSYQFTLNWDPAIWTYQSVQNISLPGATIANFNTGLVDGGGLIFEWDNATPTSVADNANIFEICFTPAVTSTPGECDQMDALGFPTVNEAVSSTSNGQNVGIITTAAELCVLFPEGFGLSVVDTEGDWQDTVCMPFTVESFNNITATDFSLSWDPLVLAFVNTNISASWPGLTFDETSANVGSISASFSNASPLAIPDLTEVFEVCFNLIGDPENCYPVEIEGTPTPTVTTSSGPGSIVVSNGELCINDRLIIDTIIITPESCPGRGDATVQIEVRGGRQPYGTTWDLITAGDTRFQPLMLSTNISAGQVAFTVYDFSGPSLSITDTITIPLLSEGPIANAGEDRTLPCNPPLLLVGCDDEDTALTYSWQRIDAPNQPVLDGCTVFFSEPGTYQLTAVDAAGCANFDTMRVGPSVPVFSDPMPIDFTEFTCATDSITLTIGSTTPVGPTIRYTWSTVVGGPVNEATQNDFDFVVYGPGRYQLTVRDLTTGCEATGETIITDGQIPVSANAGEPLEQNCDSTPVLLDGSGTSNPGLTVTYEWLDPNGVVISDSTRAEAIELGLYTLIVTDVASGCTGSATVALQPNMNAPTTNAGTDQTINCITTEVNLSGSVLPVAGTYTYTWTPIDGGALTPGTENSLEAEATLPGLYELRAINTSNNCASTDTVLVLSNTEAPVALAGLDQLQTCLAPNVFLDGSGSTQGDTISYQWFLADLNSPIAGATLDTFTSGSVGLHILQLTNEINGCTSLDSVTVDTDAEVINIVLNFLEGQLNCLNDTITISAALEPANIPFTATWAIVGPGGNIIGATDGLSIQTDQPGTYEITVTRTDNGCINEQQAIVDAGGLDIPTATITPDTSRITCLATSAILDGAGSEAGPNITYTWTNIVAGEVPVTPNANTLMVATPGRYELLVQNSVTGCESRDTVLVLDNNNPPAIEVPQEVGPITCANQQTGGVSVTVLVATIGNTFTTTWTGLDGGTANPADQPTTSLSQPGRYALLIRNPITGCETRDTILATGNLTEPEIVFGTLPEFTCLSTAATISATGTGATADFSNISWTSIDPNNTVTPATGSFTVSIDGAGQYRLSVTLAENGCSADSLITIAADQDTPTADAGEDATLECGETSSLDGNGSTSGAGITYTWTVLSGVPLTGDLSSTMPMVAGAGSYQLLVSNQTNGCTDTDTVTTIIMLPEEALAGEDQVVCNEEASLTANLPAGTTGVWSTTAAATFSDPATAQTTLTGLSGGTAIAVWTLSAPGCPNYSQDSVQISRAATPVANQDFIEITADGQRSVTLDVTANDLLNGADSLIVTLVSGPSFGLLDASALATGTLTFFAPPGIGGSSEAVYQICNADCPELCVTARIIIDAEPGEIDINVPNTITPNGDGLNEVLIFDVIEFNPADKFPNNELIIFNRWGDIVFQQAPYANAWGGEGKDGTLLPEGTYYYLLRLDISEGIILRGDITIVR